MVPFGCAPFALEVRLRPARFDNIEARLIRCPTASARAKSKRYDSKIRRANHDDQFKSIRLEWKSCRGDGRQSRTRPPHRNRPRRSGGLSREPGPSDILVNNAAVAILKGVLDQSEEEWDQVIETNLNGCFLLSKYAAQSMVKRKRGKIINVSSVGGNFGTALFPDR